MVVQILFFIYVLYAVIVLIWSSSSTSRMAIRHLVISPERLQQRSTVGSSPIIIELCPNRLDQPADSRIPGSLVVSSEQLNSLVRWTPPGATLVFKGPEAGHHLDPSVEQTLLDLGIGSVYWLETSSSG